jgi:hypothetical protein
MEFLSQKRQGLNSRPELLKTLGYLKQEREAKLGKGSLPDRPKDDEDGNRWRDLPLFLETIGTFLEYNPATFRKSYAFFSEELLLCADSSMLWPPNEPFDKSVYWISFSKFVDAIKKAEYRLPL